MAIGLVTLIGLASLSPSPATACPYSIRDSAFIGGDARPSYQLLLITDSTDESLRDSVDTATTAWLAEANVVAEIVPPDSATVRALGDRLTLDDVPANGLRAVLVSPQGRAILLGTLEADQISLDAVMRIVASAVDSPLRAQLHNELIQAWCVLLIVSGDDSEAARQVAEEARRAGERIVGTTTELDKTIERPPAVVVLQRNNIDEQVLLWSLGLIDEDADSDDVRLVMLTGRGELRGPVLEGENATEEAIYELLVMLGRSCTCTTDDTWLSGPVIPAEWGEDMRVAVEKELGFDPEDSEAIGAITGVIAGLESALGYQEAAIAYEENSLDVGAADYTASFENMETDQIMPPASTLSPETTDEDLASQAQPPATRSDDENGTTSNIYFYRIGGTVIVGGIALLVIASIVMLRNR